MKARLSSNTERSICLSRHVPPPAQFISSSPGFWGACVFTCICVGQSSMSGVRLSCLPPN
ncbi:rCG31789 [Rattus norvegicus]|uniref:RCG31789 n=1 Tax=Rattus norvegicus TaxID=10116 RepID=A6JNU0_RAT|nr:rCG31789 [Rattus norvegicus]